MMEMPMEILNKHGLNDKVEINDIMKANNNS